MPQGLQFISGAVQAAKMEQEKAQAAGGKTQNPAVRENGLGLAGQHQYGGRQHAGHESPVHPATLMASDRISPKSTCTLSGRAGSTDKLVLRLRQSLGS